MALHSPQGDEMVLVYVPIPGKVLVKSAEHVNMVVTRVQGTASNV